MSSAHFPFLPLTQRQVPKAERGNAGSTGTCQLKHLLQEGSLTPPTYTQVSYEGPQESSDWHRPEEVSRSISCSKQGQLRCPNRLLRVLSNLVIKTSKGGGCSTSLEVCSTLDYPHNYSLASIQISCFNLTSLDSCHTPL